MEYNIITNESEALKAVESVGDALQYVKDRAVFDKLNKGNYNYGRMQKEMQ